MLIAAEVSPDVELVGHGLGGTAAVEQLQQSLKALSQAAGWPAVNPGSATGSVNNQTVSAVTAVIGHLGGKINSTVQKALQMALVIASTNTTAMAAAKDAIATNASYISNAVRGLAAAYTVSKKPPAAPKPPLQPSAPFMPLMTAQYAKPAAPVPAAAKSLAIQARSAKTGLWRVAVPESLAAGLGGPAMSLGAAYHELPARATMEPGVRVVSESELEKKTGAAPIYKKPWFWAALGGGALVLGGGIWFLRR
jgi:hypothetical protein